MKRTFLFLYVLSIAFYLPTPLYAQPDEPEEELKVLQMFYKEKDLVETATRYPKPIAQVAENITVVTAAEIEAINAHTLTDILNYIPGVQVDSRGGSGSIANIFVQGSEFRHVLVMIDGVTLNNLSDNAADFGSLPVQEIEKVEIIKGPASSSWGSSLGGVINVITKSPDEMRVFGGTASASIGDRNTGDYRGEASGKSGDLGYYLSTGKLLSDGLTPSTSFDGNNVYTKLRWEPTDKTGLLFTLGYIYGTRGAGESQVYDFSIRNDFEHLFTTLALDHALSDNLDLHLSARGLKQHDDFFRSRFSTGAPVTKMSGDEATIGGSAKLVWRQGMHNLLVGADYDNRELDSTNRDLQSDTMSNGKQRLEKWALFTNDTIAIDKFSFTPGIRYDQTSTNGNFFSPSFGVTYTPAESTILRASVARGFSIPPLFATFGTGLFSLPNPGLKMEKVWSYQVGLESAPVRYLWLKTTLFRHDVTDVLAFETTGNDSIRIINNGRQRKQGGEVELKSLPLYNMSLLAGFAFVDLRDRDTGERVTGAGRITYDIGLQYDDQRSFSGNLRGHYIGWDADTAHNAFIWDLYLAKKIFTGDGRTVETFFSARNLFNSSQFYFSEFRTPGRWFEGGVRFRF
ncbi:TonB-dependent receptor plug domain-containing protein [Geotalea uraniireducens]|uniref:TonB-dependent receptor plug domain-containing protein n=1 Tax=Geotalea uraniireducens TaxID=351604 RepID=UPI00031CC585|nr:TonB-dependent receptor [Geotalea uraniireducens]